MTVEICKTTEMGTSEGLWFPACPSKGASRYLVPPTETQGGGQRDRPGAPWSPEGRGELRWAGWRSGRRPLWLAREHCLLSVGPTKPAALFESWPSGAYGYGGCLASWTGDCRLWVQVLLVYSLSRHETTRYCDEVRTQHPLWRVRAKSASPGSHQVIHSSCWFIGSLGNEEMGKSTMWALVPGHHLISSMPCIKQTVCGGEMQLDGGTVFG